MNYTVEAFSDAFNNFEIKPQKLDKPIKEFMAECKRRGLHNNDNLPSLLAFRKHKRHVMFMLKQDEKIIGTFGAHSLHLFENAYRICVRACVLTDQTEHRSLRMVNQIRTHQNLLAKYGLDACIKWVDDPTANLYISTHPSEIGAMALMHRIVLPEFAKSGLVERVGDFKYYGVVQTFWKVFPEKYYEQIS